MIRTGHIVVLLGALMIGWSVPAKAQGTPFKYQITPYFWLSGLNGTVGARNESVEVDLSIGDIIDRLDFVFMGAFEARLGRSRILADTLYIDVSDAKGVGQSAFIAASVGSKMFIFDQEVGYELLNREGTDLDVTGGIRFWHQENRLQLTGTRTSLNLQHSHGWVDPLVGLRFTSDLPKQLFVTAKADIGGFGAAARLDWQAFGGIGVQFNDTVVATVGYRNLSVDYENDGFIFDVDMRGLVLGLGLRF